jgi:hypothetical protein
VPQCYWIKHLLAICREQAKWINGDEPSSRHFMHRLPHGLAGHRKDEVEQLEREEQSNEELVGIASNAIKNTRFLTIAKHGRVMWPEMMLACTLRI